MSKQQESFKYKINEQIKKLPREISIGDLMKALKSQYAIGRDTFFRDRKIPLGSSVSIPLDRMHAYATLFGCSIDSLENYAVKGGKSIHQIVAEKHRRKVKTHLH